MADADEWEVCSELTKHGEAILDEVVVNAVEYVSIRLMHENQSASALVDRASEPTAEKKSSLNPWANSELNDLLPV